jgi:predicted transcriptional regulator
MVCHLSRLWRHGDYPCLHANQKGYQVTQILLPIRPIHVSKIRSGEKRYEYRRTLPRQLPSSILIYETTPVKKVVAIASVAGIIQDTPETVWKITHTCSGISRDYFNTYFDNCSRAYAYELDDVLWLERQKDLLEFGIARAPQSFCYINTLSKGERE